MTENDLAAIERRHGLAPRGFATGPTRIDPDIRALVAEVHRLRTALAHYADAANWMRSAVGPHRDTTGPFDWYAADPPDSNGYDVARAALGRTE